MSAKLTAMKILLGIFLILNTGCQLVNPYLGKSVPDLIVLLQSSEARERELAALALQKVGPEAAEAIPALVEALFDPEKAVRQAARDALVAIGPQAVRPLFFALQRSSETGQPSDISDNIREGTFLFDSDAIPEFIDIYNNSEPKSVERAGVISILDNMVDRLGGDAIEAAPTLVDALGDPWPPTQVIAKRALERLDKLAVPELIEGLQDPNGDVRYYSAVTLGRIGPDALEAVPKLVISLDDPVAKVRLAAQKALEEIGFQFEYSPDSSQRIYDLIDALRSPNAVVRAATTEALGDMGSEAEPALPALRQALQDPNQGVRLAAEEAIKKIEESP